MIENFKKSILRIEEAPIEVASKIIGWNSYFYDLSNQCISGGTNKDREIAQRIGFAETIERMLIREISEDQNSRNLFRLDEFRSSCGFACGFSEEETKSRSICEALERWCWSKWIDESILIPKLDVTKILTPLARYFLSQFDSFSVYSLPLDTGKISGHSNLDLRFCAVIGFKADGVFLGSRVSNRLEDCVEHSAVESQRALQIFRKSQNITKLNDFYSRRLLYYSTRANLIPKFESFKKIKFPEPELLFVDGYKKYEKDGVFLFRSVAKGYIPWEIGDETRFIY